MSTIHKITPTTPPGPVTSEFRENIFYGNPPKGYSSWGEWMQSPVKSGAKISSLSPENTKEGDAQMGSPTTDRLTPPPAQSDPWSVAQGETWESLALHCAVEMGRLAESLNKTKFPVDADKLAIAVAKHIKQRVAEETTTLRAKLEAAERQIADLRQWSDAKTKFADDILVEVRELRACRDRLTWLHSGSEKDAEGFEWGVFRVKFNSAGQPESVLHTLTDLSDLDRAMGASGMPRYYDEVADLKAQVARLEAELKAAKTQSARWKDCAEYGWSIIANAGGGDWKREHNDWQQAAAKFRSQYYACFDAARTPPNPNATQP